MRKRIQQFLHNLLALAPLLALSACSGSGHMLPLSVQDCRAAASSEAALVDIYAVRGEAERLRQTVTPVDEYFATSGLPSRPGNVYRCYLDAATPVVTLQPKREVVCKAWLADGADTLIAVTPKPARRSTTQSDPRRVVFPLSPEAYPSGTHSLVLRLTDGGLTVAPSTERLRPLEASPSRSAASRSAPPTQP